MTEIMTDWQLETVLNMVYMLLDGCKDLAEAREKVKKLLESQGAKKDD